VEARLAVAVPVRSTEVAKRIGAGLRAARAGQWRSRQNRQIKGCRRFHRFCCLARAPVYWGRHPRPSARTTVGVPRHFLVRDTRAEHRRPRSVW